LTTHTHTSYLFPYTTLFLSLKHLYFPIHRTDLVYMLNSYGYRRREFAGLVAFYPRVNFERSGSALQSLHGHRDMIEALSHSFQKDRKSTRLNSSHVSISYAV